MPADSAALRIVPDARRGDIRAHVLRDVVEPCARAVLALSEKVRVPGGRAIPCADATS